MKEIFGKCITLALLGFNLIWTAVELLIYYFYGKSVLVSKRFRVLWRGVTSPFRWLFWTVIAPIALLVLIGVVAGIVFGLCLSWLAITLRIFPSKREEVYSSAATSPRNSLRNHNRHLEYNKETNSELNSVHNTPVASVDLGRDRTRERIRERNQRRNHHHNHANNGGQPASQSASPGAKQGSAKPLSRSASQQSAKSPSVSPQAAEHPLIAHKQASPALANHVTPNLANGNSYFEDDERRILEDVEPVKLFEQPPDDLPNGQPNSQLSILTQQDSVWETTDGLDDGVDDAESNEEDEDEDSTVIPPYTPYNTVNRSPSQVEFYSRFRLPSEKLDTSAAYIEDTDDDGYKTPPRRNRLSQYSPDQPTPIHSRKASLNFIQEEI